MEGKSAARRLCGQLKLSNAHSSDARYPSLNLRIRYHATSGRVMNETCGREIYLKLFSCEWLIFFFRHRSKYTNENRSNTQATALSRCNSRTDSGRTKGSISKQQHFCLHFARGRCVKGYECLYLHHLPTGFHEAAKPALYDIFGREKHRLEREDNGGTGSHMRQCRTLFVYFGGAGEWGGQRLRQLISKSFGEWGPVEDIHVVPSKCISFVRYKFIVSAEFAKEAMMGQNLFGGKESLTVRWANDDPNPTAIHRVKREREDVIVDASERANTRTPSWHDNERRQYAYLQTTRGQNFPYQNSLHTQDYPDTEAQYEAHLNNVSTQSSTKHALQDVKMMHDENPDSVEEDYEIRGARPFSKSRTIMPQVFELEENSQKVSNQAEINEISRRTQLDSEILRAQHVAYRAYLDAGGKPDDWNPDSLSTFVAAPGSFC